MKELTIKANKFLEKNNQGFYNCEYLGYQKPNNPDFFNRLKNISGQYDELNLVEDFVDISERLIEDFKKLSQKYHNYSVCVIPRSKADKSYSARQLMFKKAVSSIANKLGLTNATEVIKRVKNTRTTHNWRLENNFGNLPYVGITKDTCEIDINKINGKNIILVDDIYTEGGKCCRLSCKKSLT